MTIAELTSDEVKALESFRSGDLRALKALAPDSLGKVMRLMTEEELKTLSPPHLTACRHAFAELQGQMRVEGQTVVTLRCLDCGLVFDRRQETGEVRSRP